MTPDRFRIAISEVAALAERGPIASFQAKALRDVLGLLELQATGLAHLQTQLDRKVAEANASRRAIANLVGCEPEQVHDPHLSIAAYYVRQEQAIGQLTDRLARVEREKDAMTELAMRATPPGPRSEP